MAVGDSGQKISTPVPQVAFWNSEGKGGGEEGGSLNWKSKGIGVLMLGIPQAWEGF